MAFRTTKNRRRVDVAQRTAEVKGTLARTGAAVSRVLLTLGVTVVVAFAGNATYRWAIASKTFALRQISFEGTRRAAQADLQKLAGLTLGQNLFQLDTAGVVRTMSSHPWVKSVRVTRHLPAALAIEIDEHTPSAMVALGELYLLDDEGEPFKKVQPQDQVDLPLVTGLDRDAYVARPDESLQRFRQAVELVRDYQSSGLSKGAALSEVRLELDGVTAVTAAGQEIFFGSGATEDKFDRLAKVRAELSRRNLTADRIHLDNRSRPGWVTVKLASLVPRKTDEGR